MRRLMNNPLVWLLLLTLFVVVGSYLIFGWGGSGGRRHSQQVQIIATANIPAEGQPVVPFAAIDPAVTERLLADHVLNNPSSFDFSQLALPPIGQYLPSEAEPRFELQPYPALAPLDNRLVEDYTQLLPIESAAAGSVKLLEYGGDGCAPAGLPVSGVLTQRYHAYHTGIDIGVPLGSPVVATHSATVLFAGWSAYGYGYLVILQNGAYITYYAHLTNFNVKGGDLVGAGSVIGWSGSTGNSTGPHLHYETRIDDIPVDPLTFERRDLSAC